MNERIPHYRNIDYQKAVSQLARENFKTAKIYGLESQRFDKYYEPAIQLLFNVAFYTKDAALFFEQFQLIFKITLNGKLIESSRINRVEISKKDLSSPMEMITQNNQVKISFNNQFIDQIFVIGQRMRSQSKWSATQRNQFANSVFSVFFRQSFFKSEIQKEFSPEKKREFITSFINKLTAIVFPPER